MSTAEPAAQPPSAWELASLMPYPGSAAYAEAVGAHAARIEALDRTTAALPPLTRASLMQWRDALLELEALEAARSDHLNFVECHASNDAANSSIQRHQSSARDLWARLRLAITPMLAHLGSADAEPFADLLAEPCLSDAKQVLLEIRRDALRCLEPEEERFFVAAEAEASRRWADLASSTISNASFEVVAPDGARSIHPASARFEFMWGADADKRRAAFDGMNNTFAPKAELMAHCYNATAGFDLAAAERRGGDLVEDIIAGHRLDLRTVVVMQAALLEYAPVLHKYLRLKARLLGLPHLGVFDRSAPLAQAEIRADDVQLAVDRVIGAFDRHCTPLAAYARRLIGANWLEHEMRAGKRAGGFQMTFPLAKETRIFMSHGGSFNSTAVLAHELGHAFHAHVNFDLRYWRQPAPAPLAETAAILCEHFLRDSIYLDDTAPMPVRVSALTSQLDAAVNYLLRIPRDFDFEIAFLRERRDGDVPATRLCELMSSLHTAWFGDALQDDDGDALSWAYNHIMADPRLRLYNFPYSFGYLLSRRIADRFAADGDAFTPAYLDFLHASGSMKVEEAVQSTLGYDVASKAYWGDCLARIDRQVALLSELVQ